MPMARQPLGASFLIDYLLFGNCKRSERDVEQEPLPASHGRVYKGEKCLEGELKESQQDQEGHKRRRETQPAQDQVCVHQHQGAQPCIKHLVLYQETQPNTPLMEGDPSKNSDQISQTAEDVKNDPHHKEGEQHSNTQGTAPQRTQPQHMQHWEYQKHMELSNGTGIGHISKSQLQKDARLPYDPEEPVDSDSEPGTPHEAPSETGTLEIHYTKETLEQQGELNWSRDPQGAPDKPNQSYIALISTAILSSPEKKLLLSDIYQWIMDSYPYFKNKEKSWRNSVRHNLSLNECFIKAGRSDNGKGHYWAIHPANLQDFSKGDYHRRRARRRIRRLATNLNYFHPYALYGMSCCSGRYCFCFPPPCSSFSLRGSSQLCQSGCPLPPSVSLPQPLKYLEKQLTSVWNRPPHYLPLQPYL